MQKYLKVIISCLAIIPSLTYAIANNYLLVIESNTPITLTNLKQKAKANNVSQLPIGDIMQWTALQLIGKPYVPALLDKSVPEYLYVSLNQTDCMLFVEEVLTVSRLIKHHQLTLSNLALAIKQVRYHGPVAYCNRNHYFKDWAVVNEGKQIVVDQGFILTGMTLPYSAHVLSDRIMQDKNGLHQEDLTCILEREQFINEQKLGFIPLKYLPKYLGKIQSGDIIGIVRSPNGKADSIHHLGIAYVHNGMVGLINASSDKKQVVIADSLTDYLARFKDSQGIILLRAE